MGCGSNNSAQTNDNNRSPKNEEIDRGGAYEGQGFGGQPSGGQGKGQGFDGQPHGRQGRGQGIDGQPHGGQGEGQPHEREESGEQSYGGMQKGGTGGKKGRNDQYNQ